MSENKMEEKATTDLEELVVKSKSVQKISHALRNEVQARITRAFGETHTHVIITEDTESLDIEEVPNIQEIQDNMTIATDNTRAIHACIESVLHQGSNGDSKSKEEPKSAPINEMREKSKILLDTSIQTRSIMESFMNQFVGACAEPKTEDAAGEPSSSDIDMTGNELDQVETQFDKMKYMIEKL